MWAVLLYELFIREEREERKKSIYTPTTLRL